MLKEWERASVRLSNDAKKILRERGLPVEHESLINHSDKIPDKAAYYARLVILAERSLHSEYNKGRIDHALNKMFDLCSYHEQMWLHALSGNNKIQSTPKIEKIISGGFRSNKGSSKGGKNKGVPQETIDTWQAMADEMIKENPSLKSVTRISDLIAEKTNSPWPPSTIRRKIKIGI